MLNRTNYDLQNMYDKLCTHTGKWMCVHQSRKVTNVYVVKLYDMSKICNLDSTHMEATNETISNRPIKIYTCILYTL